MHTLRVRSAFAAVAIAAAALGTAAVASAEPTGPCEDVTYVGVCEPFHKQPQRSPRARDRNKTPRNSRDRSRRSQEKGMVRLALSTGRAHGVRVGHVVGSLAHYADIPGRALGKIRVEQHQTFVDVPEELVSRVLSQTGTYRIGRQAIDIQQA